MEKPAILIDNGSFQCRASLQTDQEPFVFNNLIAKLRKDKIKKDVYVQVGNEIENLDAVRFALRSQFDKNIVFNFDIQETILDYLFSNLNIQSTSGEEKVENPIVLTEPFLNPNYSRQLFSELLFECYQIPSLCYGVDSLFSLYKNFPEDEDVLIVSFGNRTIHVIPMVDGKIDIAKSKRINLGGNEIAGYLHRQLQLKYPAHIITLGKVEEILINHGYIALDYSEELNKWADMNFYKKNVLLLQSSIKPQPTFTQSEGLKERRKEIARKMIEMNATKRKEKLAENEKTLISLNKIRNMIKGGEADSEEIQRALNSAGMNSVGELMKTISMIKARILKGNQNIRKEKDGETLEETSSEPKPKVFKLEIPQDKSKEEYVGELRNKRNELLKRRALRRQKRSDLSKRRSLAAQEKMKILTKLAAQKEKHDTFGMDDSDWNVYKSIQKDGGSDTEEEQEELHHLEEFLKAHDPSFANEVVSEVKASNEESELHIGLEKVRSPELIFQPSMMGENQSGLVETIEHILKIYPDEVQNRLVQNIFLTGGLSNYNGLLPRLNNDLMAIRPFQSTFKVNFAQNPVLDAWNGMKLWTADESNRKYFVSKVEYEEFGGEYLKENRISNIYYPTP